MSFNDVHPGDPMNAVNVQQVIDALKGTVGKGVPLVVDAVNDSTRYALTLQNDDTVNSRAINVLKADGSVLIAADATGVTLGSPVNLQPSSVPGTAITNASITNAKLGPDVARANLLANGGFEIWQRGNGPFAGGVFIADRWSGGTSGADTYSASKDTTNQDGASGSLACMAVTFTLNGGGGNTRIWQQLTISVAEPNQLRNRPCTFSARVRTATANAVRLSVHDGSAWNNGSYHTGDGTYQTLSMTVTPTGSAAALSVGFSFGASCTAYIDNANLVVGSQPADYVPLHPADDLARCQRYYEVFTFGGGGVMAIGMGNGAPSVQAQINPFGVRKPVAPSTTATGLPSIFAPGVMGPATASVFAASAATDWWSMTASASGVVNNGMYLFVANPSSSRVTFEANP